MRRVGWAAWHRTPAQGFDHHIHGIAGPAGPGDLAPAASDQWADYLNGRNGLANNAPDDGPRDFVGVTWEQYQSSNTDEWLIEGVVPMAAKCVTFFHRGGTVYEADLIAGTYRGVANPADLQDRKNVLTECGIPWSTWRDGAEVGNPDAFGVLVD